jgi:hypothetical protein
VYPTIKALETEYRSFNAVKAADHKLADAMVLFNQTALTEAGRIHWFCLDHWDTGGREAYKDFITNTFSGMYYADWRAARAVSCRHVTEVCSMLGIHWKDGELIGETFYAGIPPVTMAEIEAAGQKSEPYKFVACSEKIGNDGVYRPVDEFGDFDGYPYDPNDIYGDGTGVKV